MGHTACTEPQCLYKGALYLYLLPAPPTILQSSLTSSCHLFLGLPLNLVVPKFIYNTLLIIPFSSILCTCPNQHNLFNLIVYIIVGFLTHAKISSLVNPLNAELNPICSLLALLGAHHFLQVSRIRVKSLTLRLLMSYIYMEHLFLMFLDHTRQRTTVGRTPLDE